MNNAEFFEALKLLEKEKGIPGDYLLEKIRAAIIIAVKRDFGGKENIVVVMEPATGEFNVSLHKTVVEEVVDPDEEMTLDEAQRYKKNAKIGDVVEIQLETKQFGRIAAQTAKHVIRQGIREAERGQQLQEFQRRNQELVTALVTRVDRQNRRRHPGNRQGRSRPAQERADRRGGAPRGRPHKGLCGGCPGGGQGPQGPHLPHPSRGWSSGCLRWRCPRFSTALWKSRPYPGRPAPAPSWPCSATTTNVDAVGACIGPRGARVAGIVDELGGEKIDIVEYSDEPEKFIAAALSPAKVLSVEVDPDGARSCRVTVPDAQLSLAIGNKGQNARLAAKLTGWKIDIRPESGFYGEDEENA